jgi:UDP-N-acetylglucosamine transferase subunit ALG13
MRALGLFYVLKPLIPRRLQIGMRRTRARIKRNRNSGTWPIDPVASRRPDGWRGWPEGREFALALIHDVDTARGLDRCLRLIDLEKSLGFASCFNFVPKGYPLPETLRREIVEAGFDVGVHGLTHEGRTFKDARSFSRLVPEINGFLKEWNAAGYTSPAMLGNLRWIVDLDAAYGCSSFDTDPFEPRPYGVRTIFPFLVPHPDKDRSYVELPYTLPQDHALFVLLREGDDSVWRRKVDWIAEHGGMVLLNTHPDYMSFGEVDRYTSLLQYVRSRYEDRYWHALPRDVARFWKTAYPRDASYVYDGSPISASDRVASLSHANKYHRPVKLALTCSAGGHFEQMQNLYRFYQHYPRFWIVNETPQTEYALSAESRHFIKGAHFSKPWTYLVQAPRVLRILRRERPTHIISTGPGMIGFSPFLLSRLLGIKFIHLETFSHVHHLTKLGRLIRMFRHPILSQWDGLDMKYVRSIGPAISDSLPDAPEKVSEEIVFVALGMRVHPFPRIIKAVESLIRDDVILGKVVIQRGFTDYPTEAAENFDFRTPAEINKLIAASKYVITQESAGIVTKCLRLGKRFIVMPRDYRYGELPAKSDMNEDLHEKLAELGFTFVVQDKDQLKEAIGKVNQLKTGFRFDNSRAISALKAMVEGAGDNGVKRPGLFR